MADSKITALTALTAADPANDMIPIVDVSDTPPASGNTKRISINNILACSPSATLASATITGDLTVKTNVLKVDTTNNRVGIGTATPSGAELDVAGAMRSNSWLGRSNVSAPTADCAIYRAADNTFAISTANTERLRIDSSGNVGIGVTPSVRLDLLVADVTEGARFRSTSGWLRMIPYQSATDGCRIFATNSANTAGIPLSIEGFNLRFNTNAGNAMILDNLGNIILSPPTTPPALGTNGQLTFTATSNTNLRFSYRGSDGTTRVANITLA